MSNRSDNTAWRKDSTLSFEGGVDSGRNPSFIDANQVASATNSTMRGGTISPRSGIKKLILKFPDTGDTKAAFSHGRFQHGDFYDGDIDKLLLSSHGGRIFKINLSDLTVSEIPMTRDLQTTTLSNFTILAVGTATSVHVASTEDFLAATVRIGDHIFTVSSVIDGDHVSLINNDPAAVGVVIAQPATIDWSLIDRNSALQDLGWSVQAENYWIYQDNQSSAIIFDGTNARRSNAKRSEVPVGNVMAYTMGRIAVALPDRTSFRIGDLLGGSSGSPQFGYFDSILRFTENDYLNEGGDFVARVFGAPSASGPITSMKAGSMADTQLGQGPLIVGTPLQVFTVNLPFDRTTWKQLSSALQTVNPVIGPLSQTSTVLINSDLWYRSIDGIRSYIMAQRDFQSWGNRPMSTEVSEVLSFDTESLLEHSSAVLFDNRLLMTVSPTRSPRGVWHRGLVALDFFPVSGIGKGAHPAWDGSWSGPRILQLVKGIVDHKERCFLYGLDENDNIGLWELFTDEKFDDSTTPINWTVDFRSYNCGDADSFKKLETARFVIQELEGTLTVNAKYRSDQNACWQQWDSVSVCSKNLDCGPPDCAGPQTLREQQRSPIKLRMPPDDFDDTNRRKYRTGYEFQPRLEMSGYAELKQLRIFCLDEPEGVSGREDDFT